MKLPDCAFNIDVKSAFNFLDPLFLLGVTVCQRGAEIKKHPVFIIGPKNAFLCWGWKIASKFSILCKFAF